MTSIEATTISGTVRGTVEGGVARFLGIPYAAAPFGEHRFRPTQPHPGWSGVRDALQLGATAPAGPYPPVFRDVLPEPVIPGDEILTVNVWAPADASGAPVMVFIHGGAFVNGSNAVPVYDGTAFARDGIVLVSVNYRLGAEGFLKLPGGPANLGILDQVAALTWVRDNIAAFGGDPGRVTVFGESAGAMSVGTLLAMPAAEGLFQRAILQSGAAHNAYSVETAEKIATLVAAQVGLAPAELGQVPPERLVRAHTELLKELRARPDPVKFGEAAAGALVYVPIVDGESLPGRPIDRIAAGSATDVEVLIGTTRDEVHLFTVAGGMTEFVTDAAMTGFVGMLGLPDGAVDRYRAGRPGGAPWEVLSDVMTDQMFRIPAIRLAEAHGRAWVYEFDWPAQGLDGRLGACHAVELPFVFDTLAAAEAMNGPDAPQELADTVHGAWVAFASGRDPGWARYGDARTVRTFGAATETADDPRGATRELWAGVR
ncbi:carboxylesterase/lipase family protein [Pseudonocardia sp. CA-107938]|uniref:carboxylesterase/lipase family protein n=1 Tax=Pseudonocardia sp. CA-107938 TaxID=3240021 RepID=UPI003D8A5C8B